MKLKAILLPIACIILSECDDIGFGANSKTLNSLREAVGLDCGRLTGHRHAKV